LRLHPADRFLPAPSQEVDDTERHLLYVACMRARDHLLITGVDPVSEFLDDFAKGDRVAPARRFERTGLK
jgi:superfamily I DNA/RNA helicase